MNRAKWWSGLAAFLIVAAGVSAAFGTISIAVGNGDLITGELTGPDDVQRFRVFVPEGAKLSVSAKGLKTKEQAAPSISLRVLDDVEDEVSDGLVKTSKRGARAKLTIEFTGEHVIEVFGTGESIGRYRFSAKWKSPTKFKLDRDEELFGEDDELDLFAAADRDAQITVKVKAKGKGSTAQPVLDRVEFDDGFGVDEDEFVQALDGSTKLKKEPLLGRGDFSVVIRNIAGEGGVAGSAKIRPPKAKKRKFELSADQLETEDGGKAAVGEVVSPTQATLVEADGADIVGDLFGPASVLVPPGAVSRPTAILIGSSPALPPPVDVTLSGAGPTIFFGPSGLEFEVPVTVTIPFDPDLVDGSDTSGLRVFTRDADGNVEEISDLTVNLDDGTVSFPVSHFSSFRVFLPPRRARFDLNDDGEDDLALPAPGVDGSPGHAYVFFGPLDEKAAALSTSNADVSIASGGVGFGGAVAIGDLNGDGIADLVVLGNEVNDGSAHVFFGGAGFGPTTRTDDDVTIQGAVGSNGFDIVATGDVSGDGIDDLVLSAEDGVTGEGDVWVFFGGTSFQSGTTSAADATIRGEQAGDLFGASLGVADVTGDGNGDLVVGADMIDNTGRTGAVYVFPGGPTFAPTLTNEIVLSGSGPDAGLGLNIALGDITGDGVADIAASEFDELLGGPGRVFVFEGGTGLTSTSTSGALVGFLGDGQDDLIGWSLAILDTDGDNAGELFIGASGAASDLGAIFQISGADITGGIVSGASNSPGTAQVVGEGELESFPVFGPSLDVSGAPTLVAFAPGNDVAASFAGAAYLFLGGLVPDLGAEDADIVIRGRQDEQLGGDVLD